MVLRDTSFITKNDTILFLSTEEIKKIKVRESPELRTLRFFDSIRSRSSETRIAKEVVSLILKSKATKASLPAVVVKNEDAFKQYEGYVIGSITFKAVDLLEGSVIDTLQKTSTTFGKFINHIHKDTRASIVQRNLLFATGDKVDPYQLADNERILRQFRTMRDARIQLKLVDDQNKVVDIVVVTQDVASIGVNGAYTSLNNFRGDLFDINALGYAQQLQFSYFRRSTESPVNGFGVLLRNPNIRGSFIQSEIQYVQNFERTQARISIARDFFTPDIKYAGGFELFTTREKFYLQGLDTIKLPYHENRVDAWLGRSFNLKKRVNLITSLRFYDRVFFDRPFVSADSNSYFYNRSLTLGSLTVTERNYMKSSLIRGFGRTEDIPIGHSVGVLIGREPSEFYTRSYLELNGSISRYNSQWGYVSARVALGSYVRQTIAEEGVFSFNTFYFSNLFKIKRVRSRQFITNSYTKGLNRTWDKRLGTEGKWYDVKQQPPYGSMRWTTSFENVYFLPGYTYGFRFALYHLVTVNLLGDHHLFSKENLYTSVGGGIRTLNENFVLPTFSLGFNYYVKRNAYAPDFEIKFSTQLKKLFGNDQTFKPAIASFQ